MRQIFGWLFSRKHAAPTSDIAKARLGIIAVCETYNLSSFTASTLLSNIANEYRCRALACSTPDKAIPR
jgi:hypothetical protein